MDHFRTPVSRVSLGASVLDAYQPDWFDCIDAEALEMRNEFNCILGQLFGNYQKGLDVLFDGDLDMTERKAHGFTWHFDEGVSFEVLDAEWRRLILARRIAKTREVTANDPTLTQGDVAYSVTEAIRLGRQVKESGDLDSLIALLVAVSGGDRNLFLAVFE